jgi:hypothetical protein
MQVTRDGEFVLIQIPEKDLESMVRFIAHSLIIGSQNLILDLSQEIVTGDLLKQDEVVKNLARVLELNNYQIVLTGPEALALCDELAEKVYEKQPEPKDPKPTLKLVTICVRCHKSKIKGETCDCEVSS